MVALLRHGARRMGGSMLQRTQAAVTSPAVAEQPRRLVPRRMYRAEEGAGEDKLNDKVEAFIRFDAGFTKVLNSVAGVYCIYGILACADDPPWPVRKYVHEYEEEEEAQTDKKGQK